MKIGQPAAQLEIWDEGTYPAKVTAVESAESTFPGNEGKPRLKWTFQVRNEDEIADIWYWSNATLSAHKLATFRPIVAVLAPELNLDDPHLEVDTDDLVGKRCRVILGIDQERGRNRIEKVLPAEARKVTKPTAPPAAVDDDVRVPAGAGAPPF